jgi:alcohol dehydrogenase (cytochrome c)
MTRFLKYSLAALLSVLPAGATAQYLDPAAILKADGQSWPTYSGDYSGKRFSPLTQINQSNVKNLSLAWTTRVSATVRGANGAPPTIVGGVGTIESTAAANIRASVLEVDGILYFSVPDNAWAVDARSGRELWHYLWRTRGGTHIGNRGLGMWHDRLYMETPDDFLVCLNAKTGAEIWHKEIASFALQYFSTMAPVVIGNHVLVGTGDDLDEPGMLQSFNPETGEIEWKWYAVPMDKSDPALSTWATLDAASHGGGNVWVPGSYDPETHLYIFGTANPTAAYTSQMRGPGPNLYTCSEVAVNVDTGKMAWYYQTSPHDTHDFDSAQTPVLVDAEFGGKPRKLVMTAARNGCFFVLDRVTGEHLLTAKASETVNWASDKLDKDGHPVRIPDKDYSIGGALVSPANQGIVNWPPPTFNPQTNLFYVQSSDSYAMYYLATLDPRGAIGLGGKDELSLGAMGNYINAIDYKTGKFVWRHRYSGTASSAIPNGLLSTAGKLLFGSDPVGNLIAYNPATGEQLWHSKVGVTNAPETYMLDGKQYVLIAGGDSLYAFTLN